MSGAEVKDRLEKMLYDSGALLEGHFLLTSGLHSGYYLQCSLLLRFPWYAAFVGEKLAKLVEPFDPQIIASPALGGIIVGHEVARALGVPFIFCEREGGQMRLRRFPAPEGMRFAVIEDVVTTGGSVKEVGEVLEILGGKWETSGCIVDRTTQDVQLPVELLSLTKKTFPVYKPEECPFCKKGYPLVKPGSRKR